MRIKKTITFRKIPCHVTIDTFETKTVVTIEGKHKVIGSYPVWEPDKKEYMTMLLKKATS